MTRTAVKLAVVAALMTAGVVAVVMQQHTVGVAAIVFALAMIGMLLDKRHFDAHDRPRPARNQDEPPTRS